MPFRPRHFPDHLPAFLATHIALVIASVVALRVIVRIILDMLMTTDRPHPPVSCSLSSKLNESSAAILRIHCLLMPPGDPSLQRNRPAFYR
jgi:hypothetical protein